MKEKNQKQDYLSGIKKVILYLGFFWSKTRRKDTKKCLLEYVQMIK
jgi:hypothetical protein